VTKLMRSVLILFVVVLSVLPQIARAQESFPGKRQLPPSMRAELTHRESVLGHRIVFHDTLKSGTRKSALLRDTMQINDPTLAGLSDSALAISDSSVSLSHKQWIDSQIVEVPELIRNGAKVRYAYPQQIMVDIDRHPVPFDSTVLAGMNPITRENLPYFDQSPLPLPLRQKKNLEAMLEVGAGVPYLPRLAGALQFGVNDRIALGFNGDYLHRQSDDPIEQYWNFAASGAAQIGNEPEPFQSSSVGAHLSLTGKQLLLYHDSASAPVRSEHTLSVTNIGALIDGDLSRSLAYGFAIDAHFLSDGLDPSLSESSQNITAHSEFVLGHSEFSLLGALAYEHASAEPLPNPSGFSTAGFANSTDLSAQNISLMLKDETSLGFQWRAGLKLVSANDIDGSRTKVFPIGGLGVRLTKSWEVGGSFEPASSLDDNLALANVNPFYTLLSGREGILTDPEFASSSIVKQSVIDPRRTRTNNFDLRGYTHFTYSADDEIRAEIRLVESDHELVFRESAIDSGRSLFYALPEETRRLIVSAGGNALIFSRDVIGATFEYHSATVAGKDIGVQFEPVLKASLAYHLNAFGGTDENSFGVLPSVEFVHLARNSKSLSFLNLDANVRCSRQIAILLKAENILNSPGDFWTSYNEMPRSIWVSARLTF
jgi:hypothetical protein